MASWWEESYNAANIAGFPYPSVFAEQMRVESADFDEDVIYCRSVNPSGARGIAQIVPIWRPTVDPCNPAEALQYAANWMNSLLNEQGGRIDLALVYYNGGGDAVFAWESGQPWAESQSYVERITGQPYSVYVYRPTVESGGDGSGEVVYDEESSLGGVIQEVIQAIVDAVTPQSDYETAQV